MKRSIAIALSITAAALAVGFSSLASDPQDQAIPIPAPKIADPLLSTAQAELDARLTGIPPTCEELTTRQPPVARVVGEDWVIVIPNQAEDYYFKFGIHIPPGRVSPVVIWQGAGLSGAVQHSCEGNSGQPQQPVVE